LEVADDFFCRMLRHATVAGACRILARREPGAAKGLFKAANQHSAQSAKLLNEWVGLATEGRESPAPAQSRLSGP
jgi:hypothetical protein